MNAVDFQGVSKVYPIYEAPGDRLKELLTFNRRCLHREFWALREVSFQLARGETFCIIGENGSGKSTLLQCVAGILRPTRGTVMVSGRVAALLELGAGFNPEFSGRDNVYLNGAVLGFSTAEISRRFKDIQDFAEIGDFIDRPVRTYSTGMIVRLAFAVAIHVDPEILLVDEALAVGDLYFRQRCLRKVYELRTRGTTILFVSHSLADVKALGDRTLWLDHGTVKALGDTDRVVARYLSAMADKDTAFLSLGKPSSVSCDDTEPSRPEIAAHIPNIDHRCGDGRAQIIGIAVLDPYARPIHLLEPLSRIVVRITVRASSELPTPVVGFTLRNHLGIEFSGTNTARQGMALPTLRPGDIQTIDFHLDLPALYPGSFSFSPSISNGTLDRLEICDSIDNALTLQMSHGEGPVYGYVHLPCRVELNGRLGTAGDMRAEALHA